MSDLSQASIITQARILADMLQQLRDDDDRQRALLSVLRVLDPVTDDTDASGPMQDFMNTLEVNLGADPEAVNARVMQENRAEAVAAAARFWAAEQALPLTLRRWI